MPTPSPRSSGPLKRLASPCSLIRKETQRDLPYPVPRMGLPDRRFERVRQGRPVARYNISANRLAR